VGAEIQRESFTKADFDAFDERLRAGLVALEQVLARPGFGEGERTIGAELEMFLVDEAGRPLAVGDQVLRRLGDERVTHELGAFNVELNTDPVALAGTPFSRLGADIAATLARIRGAAGAEGGRLFRVCGDDAPAEGGPVPETIVLDRAEVAYLLPVANAAPAPPVIHE
jgi:hypothetical protein